MHADFSGMEFAHKESMAVGLNVTGIRFDKKELIIEVNKLSQPFGWSLQEALNNRLGLA